MPVQRYLSLLGEEAQRGITLLEVVISIAILGFGIVMLIQFFSGGLRLAGSVVDHTDAVVFAKEKMSEALLRTNMKEDTINGTTEDGFEWTVEVSPFEIPDKDTKEKNIFEVTVTVRKTGGRSAPYKITSLKYAAFE